MRSMTADAAHSAIAASPTPRSKWAAFTAKPPEQDAREVPQIYFFHENVNYSPSWGVVRSYIHLWSADSAPPTLGDSI